MTTCFNVTRALLLQMIRNNYGRIINVSSVTGPLVSDPGESAYSVAKAAMAAWMRLVNGGNILLDTPNTKEKKALFLSSRIAPFSVLDFEYIYYLN